MVRFIHLLLSLLAISLGTAGLSSVLGPAARADRSALQSDGPAASESVADWIEQLNSDRFVERESATSRLMAAGGEAVDPVASAVRRGNREVMARGILVLRELALVDEQPLARRAERALRQIAADETTASARHADAALADLAQLRGRRAVREIRRLGGQIDTPQHEIGRQIVPFTRTLTLDESFQGNVDDLHMLRYLHEVDQIHLVGRQVTDEWLRHVKHMPGLSLVVLQETKVSDAGIAELADLDGLKRLAVLYSPITDESVPHLKTFQQAQELRLYGTNITPDAADELEQALAGTNIDYRGGAFLGVQCSVGAAVCEVQLVQPGSAAEDAGVRPGDIVVGYKGEEVPDFDTLVEMISEDRPGDEVAMTVRRNGKLLEKNVKLGQ